MRLIEANPLIEFFEQKRIEWFDLDIGASTAYDIAKQAVEETETVEAIPIKWIEVWKKHNDFHSRSTSQIVNKLIKDYRNAKPSIVEQLEQEARVLDALRETFEETDNEPD